MFCYFYYLGDILLILAYKLQLLHCPFLLLANVLLLLASALHLFTFNNNFSFLNKFQHSEITLHFYSKLNSSSCALITVVLHDHLRHAFFV